MEIQSTEQLTNQNRERHNIGGVIRETPEQLKPTLTKSFKKTVLNYSYVSLLSMFIDNITALITSILLRGELYCNHYSNNNKTCCELAACSGKSSSTT